MSDKLHIKQILLSLDGKGYTQYKKLNGQYNFTGFTLFMDHIQGDPFAQPSKIRLRVSQKHANIPTELWNNSIRKIALEDFFTRAVNQFIKQNPKSNQGSGKSGLIYIDSGKQEILERTALVITKNWIEARVQIGLPAAGRRILGKIAEKILCNTIPEIVQNSLRWKTAQQEKCRHFVECAENQDSIQNRLYDLGLSAFIANGSVLPRESGISDKPLDNKNVVPFRSPETFEVELKLPNPLPNGDIKIKGMGIPKGVTLIVGGGFNGKSTLLKAIEMGVYPHIPADGREYVITSKDAVKIRSEDGRKINNVNIDSFITNLPQNISTKSFSTDDASGSTSQSAAIMEALEIEANLLLMDEDTSATNFLVRDARMQKLVQKDYEPITPFVDRVRELYDKFGVSTILVMGGSGDYFDNSDTVIQMQDFIPHDVGKEVKIIVDNHPSKRLKETGKPFVSNYERFPLPKSFSAAKGKRQVKIDANNKDNLFYGIESVDLRYLDQLAEQSQTRAIGHAIYLGIQTLLSDSDSLFEMVEKLNIFFDQNGLDRLDPFFRAEKHPGNFSRPRKYEIAAAINRMRNIRIE